MQLFIQFYPDMSNQLNLKKNSKHLHAVYFHNNSVFASEEKNKEQIITCGIRKQLCVGLQLSQLSLENIVSLPTFTRMEIVGGGSPLTGHLFFWDIWAAMAWRCHPGQGFVAQALVYLYKNKRWQKQF